MCVFFEIFCKVRKKFSVIGYRLPVFGFWFGVNRFMKKSREKNMVWFCQFVGLMYICKFFRVNGEELPK